LIDQETGELITHQADPKAQAALFAKIAKVMGKLGRIEKRGHNAHFNYDFVTDSDVSDAIRTALASENVAFFASMRRASTDGKRVVADFLYTFADGETGATWDCQWTGEAIDSQDKGTAKAATSALKYFLLKTFILSTGDPADDSDAETAAPAKKQRQQKPTNGKPADPMTLYWATAKELGIDNAVAKAYLEECKGDPTQAQAKLVKKEVS